MSSRLRANPSLVYGLVLALTGAGKGMWQGAYAWFLSVRMGFTPTEIGFVIGSQFIVQIVLEIPSGAWADRGRTRRVLVFAYLAFAAYCLAYLALSQLSLVGGWAVIAALVPEALFGVGAALFSGTLEGWICELEREATNENDQEFAQRLRGVHSINQMWSAVPCALFGGIAFTAATLGFDALPWLGGAVAYLLALVVVVIGIDSNTRERNPPSDPDADLDLVELVGGHVGRAMAFLRNRPEAFRLFLCSALAYMPFYATQVLWVYFLIETLNVSASNPLGTLGVGTIPLIAALWSAGEMARALGGWTIRNSISTKPRSILVGIIGSLGAYSVGIVIQVLAVLLDKHEVGFFVVGYLIARYSEGRFRRDVAVLKDQWILNERATLQSIDSFIRSIVGLVFLMLIGAALQTDPIFGYLVIALIAAIAACEMALLRRSIPRDPVARPKLSRRERTRWGDIFRNFVVSRYGFYLVAVVVLASVPLFFGAESRPVWGALNQMAPDGVVVEVKATRDMSRVIPSKDGTKREVRLTRWSFESKCAEGTSIPVGCRLLIRTPADLWDADLDGAVRARIHRSDRQYFLDIEVTRPAIGKKAVELTLAPDVISSIRCLRLKGDAFEFEERLVIPTKIIRLTPQNIFTTSILIPELIFGFSILGLLLGMGIWVGRTRLENVLKLAPGTLLDLARKVMRKSPDEILNPKDGLPLDSFKKFEEILASLDATSLIIGGCTEHIAADGATTPKTNWVWYHNYKEEIVPWHESSAKQLVSWVLDRHPLTGDDDPEDSLEGHDDQGPQDGIDDRTRRLNEKVPLAEVAIWPRRTSVTDRPADAQTLKRAHNSSHEPPGARYAACAVVRRADLEGDEIVWKLGFAIAVYGRDKAPRYIATTEGQLLRLLADLARLQADRARRNVKEWDTMHWAKSILDMIRLPIEIVQTDIERLPDTQRKPELILTMTGIHARVLLARQRLADRLDSKISRATKKPVALIEELDRITKLFTHSRYGSMKVELVCELGQELHVHWDTWVLIEGALIELLWNAGKHGPAKGQPEFTARLSVTAESGGRVKFLVENPVSAAPDEDISRGYGLETIPVRIEEQRGQFLRLSFDKTTNTASTGFVLPIVRMEQR